VTLIFIWLIAFQRTRTANWLIPFKRDIIRELSDACQRHGLRFGVYYSYAQDWDDPNSSFDARFHRCDIHHHLPADFERDLDGYIAGKALPQIEELVSNYPIDLLWFDTPKDMTFDRAAKLRDTIRRHRPNCLINSRIFTWGIGRIEQENLEFFDYVSIGDLEVPDRKLPIYFESLDSVGSFYGYKAHGEFSYHTPGKLIQRMVRTVCAGGNYLLNCGPMGDGRLDPEAVRLYGIIGEWMRLSGESGSISLPDMGAGVLQILFLFSGAPCTFTQEGGTVVFALPEEPVNEYNSVLEIRLKAPLESRE